MWTKQGLPWVKTNVSLCGVDRAMGGLIVWDNNKMTLNIVANHPPPLGVVDLHFFKGEGGGGLLLVEL